MPKTKLNIIKPALGVTHVSDTDLLARLNAIHDGLLNNPAFPTPPVDMAGFKAAIDAYTAAVAAALDGGKASIAERNKRRADVVIMMRLLGHYVEVACKGDTKTFISSGFVAAPTHPRTPAQPLSAPSIQKSTRATRDSSSSRFKLFRRPEATTSATHRFRLRQPLSTGRR